MRRRTLIGVAAALTGILAPAPAHASTSMYTFFEAPREMGSDDTPLRQSALDEIAGLGVRQQRVLLNWNVALRRPCRSKRPADLTERDPNSAGYDWARYDAILGEAEQRGIRVMFTVTGSAPKWASQGKCGANVRPSAKAFGRFVEAVGRRYGPRISQWSIWNEPNQPQFLKPQYVKGRPTSPRLYRALYKAAVNGLVASGNGDDQILAGETSPRGNANVVAPITFLRGFFRGAKLRVDGYAHHPYTTRAGPFFVPKKVDVTIGVLPRLTRALDRYSKHRKLGVYLTEFGTQSRPDTIIGVPLRQQNEFRAIAERIAYDNPRVMAFSQYLLRDDLPRKGVPKLSRYSGFESGLRTSAGKEKPAYAGFRLPLVLDRFKARRMQVWALVRPTIGTPTPVTVQYRMKRKHGSRRWRTFLQGTTDVRGYLSTRVRYRAYREYRIVWTAPDGTVFRGPTTRVYRAP